MTTSMPFPDDVRGFVESTPWTFAKTYAATWPHEYVVMNDENAAMIRALARHIFEHGVEGRFYAQVRKYHHEGRKGVLVHGRHARGGGADQPLRRGPDLRSAARGGHAAEKVKSFARSSA